MMWRRPVRIALAMSLRRRVRGAYFAVLTQALAAAFVILLVGQQRLIGGTNGLTGIQYAFGLNRYDPQVKKSIYFIVLAVLGLLFVALWWLVSSRFGRLLVAVRDGEDRVRFLGYDPAVVKTAAFALSATCAGIGGAMFVIAVGSINPSLMGIVPSIEMLIGVALGGRFVLVGAVAGTLLFHYAKTTLSEAWEESWNYFYGGLFVALMVFAPRGLVGTCHTGLGGAGAAGHQGHATKAGHAGSGGCRMTGIPLLEVRGLNVVFDGFKAVTDLDLTVDHGELRFLIGPNGAGKTTLIDVITGRTRPASGTVTFDGRALVGLREHQIVRLGVGRTFQTSVVFERLTVEENLDLAASFRRPRGRSCPGGAAGCPRWTRRWT